jgi:hypothetical protein
MSDVPLRDYIDERCNNLQAEMDRRMVTVDRLRTLSNETLAARFEAIDKAASLAALSLDKRLESMNEFRQQLNHQAATFITRSESDERIKTINTVHDSLEMRVQALERMSANVEGRMWALGAGLTVLTIIVSIGLHFIH